MPPSRRMMKASTRATTNPFLRRGIRPAGPRTTGAPTRQWLSRQRTQEIRKTHNTRSPSAGAIKDFLRLTQEGGEHTAPEQNPTRTRRVRTFKPLPRQIRVLQPAVLVGRSFISRGELQRLEEMIVTQGLPNAVAMAAMRHPLLAELLQSPAAFREFVEKMVPPKWQKRLLAFLNTSNPELRAVGLLLYLRKVHRNPREIAEGMTMQSLRRMQQPKAA